MAERLLQGLPAAPGLAGRNAGPAPARAGSRARAPEERRPLGGQRAHAALTAAAAELEALAARLEADGRADEAEIVRTGVLMAEDPGLVADVERGVLDGLAAA